MENLRISHFDLGDGKIVMVLIYLMVSNGKVHLENQENKILASPSNYMTLSPLSSLPFFFFRYFTAK